MAAPERAPDRVIRRASARVQLDGAELDLHYRVAGAGPPLFLLHPSPLDSGFMVPLMQRLAHRATLIAPDTPGFGDSDALPHSSRDLTGCVRAIAALRRSLGLGQVGVYGSATGAQVAAKWARTEPEALAGVMLDNAAAFDDTERKRILTGYLPDVVPSADGSHLARAWQAAHDATLFFPWQFPHARNRIAPGLGSAEAMHVTASGYLRAGPAYEAVYRAAFEHERVENLLAVSIPLVVLRWQGSILARWSQALDVPDWGRNVTMAHCGASVEERWACLEAHLGRILPEVSVSAHDLCLDTGRMCHADTGFGQVRYTLGEAAPPARLLLPSPGASTAAVAPFLGTGDVVVDLPGHGGSSLPRTPTLSACVEAVRRVASALGKPRLDVAGVGVSELVARTAANADRRLSHAVIDAPGYRGTPPDLAPEESGAHLFRGWQWLRAGFLARNEPPPEPARLTAMLLDLIDSRAAHAILDHEPDPAPPALGLRPGNAP